MKITMGKKFSLIILFFFIGCFFAHAGETYVPLKDAAERLKAHLYWDSVTGAGLLEKNNHTIQFQLSDGLILVDSKKFEISEVPLIKEGTVYVSEKFTARAEQLFAIPVSSTHFRIGAILIDPGHGGKDVGAVGTHYINGKKLQVFEKDVVLSVSKILYDLLKKKYTDKKILLTRSDDVFLSLEQRVEMANSIPLAEHEAVLYISIHANAAFDKKANGFEVWYLSPGYRRSVLPENSADKELIPILNSMLEEEFTTESILIAKFILDSLDVQIGSESPNRGIKEEEWFVVRNANMPSVLVEVGFVSNQKEAELLTQSAYLNKISVGVYNGLCAFITHFERLRGFTEVDE